MSNKPSKIEKREPNQCELLEKIVALCGDGAESLMQNEKVLRELSLLFRSKTNPSTCAGVCTNGLREKIISICGTDVEDLLTNTRVVQDLSSLFESQSQTKSEEYTKAKKDYGQSMNSYFYCRPNTESSHYDDDLSASKLEWLKTELLKLSNMEIDELVFSVKIDKYIENMKSFK